jgi:Yip1 domain
MPEQAFALDATGNSVQVYVLDEPDGAWVAINRSSIGNIPSREALRAGQEFTLQDGSTLKVQLVENQLQVFRAGQRLAQMPYAVPPQQAYYQPQAYYEYVAPPQVPYGAFPYQQPGYSYGAPPQLPYGAFPYQQPGYGTPPVQAAPLPLGKSILQLPGQYIKVVFSKPFPVTFAEEQSKASWGSVWFQLIFYALVGSIIVFVSELIRNIAISGLELIFIIFFAIIIIPIGFFVITGIYYLLARAFGGKGTFLAQSYSLLLITVPLGILMALLNLIPVLGSLAGLGVDVYITILSILMIIGVHRLSGGKASAVILIPVAFFIFIGVLIVIAAFALRPA